MIHKNIVSILVFRIKNIIISSDVPEKTEQLRLLYEQNGSLHKIMQINMHPCMHLTFGVFVLQIFVYIEDCDFNVNVSNGR